MRGTCVRVCETDPPCAVGLKVACVVTSQHRQLSHIAIPTFIEIPTFMGFYTGSSISNTPPPYISNERARIKAHKSRYPGNVNISLPASMLWRGRLGIDVGCLLDHADAGASADRPQPDPSNGTVPTHTLSGRSVAHSSSQ